MLNILFKLFSKDYNKRYLKSSVVYQEIIIPYENIILGSTIKGNIYLRKTKKIYTYEKYWFKDDVEMIYNGLLHIRDTGNIIKEKEKSFEIKPLAFDNDKQFLDWVYRKYTL